MSELLIGFSIGFAMLYVLMILMLVICYERD